MKLQHFILLLFALASLPACNPLRFLSDNEQLLNKNIIKSNHPELNEQLEPIIKQKPNRKIGGVMRLHLMVYNLFNKGKERRLKSWIKNTIGEAPVIVDSTLTKRSSLQMKLYLQNKGYFNAELRDSTVMNRNKQVNVWYLVNTGTPYTIRNTTYISDDTAIRDILNGDRVSSLLKTGNNFDSDVLQKERERITSELKNRGYFYFSKDFIFYNIDSALGTSQVDIFTGVKKQQSAALSPDSANTENHHPYTVNNIYIQTDFNPHQPESGAFDTLLYRDFIFLNAPGNLQFKPDIILQTLFLRKNKMYLLREHEETYSRLSDLGMFRFINLRFEEVKRDTLNNSYLIDCFVQLTPSLKQSFSLEAEGTHNVGNLGIAGNFVYRNKNTFKGIEVLELKIKGGVESQRSVAGTEGSERKLLLFNTIEIGPEASLTFQKFILPFRIKGLSQYFNPKTNLKLNYNYQQRPGYFNHSIANFSFGYSWKESSTKTHTISLAENSLVKVQLDSLYEARLIQLNDRYLINSYRSHLSLTTRYTFLFNNQGITRKKFFQFFRGSFEFGGNLLRIINNSANSPAGADGSYELLGIKYAQFVRMDADYRIYKNITPFSSVVVRAYAGGGIPYGNSTVMPYEKSFFAGGPNGIRAWRARTLGPGSHSDILALDQTGDVKLEGNLEIRSELFKMLEGALFIDVGNVWLLNEDLTRTGAKFSSEFWNETAIGAGAGIRLNFNFFIFRLDGGIPLKDPSRPVGQRWVTDEMALKKVIFNLGIGYPF